MIIIVVGFLRRLHRPKYRVFNLKIVVKRNRAKTTTWSTALLTERNATQDVEVGGILLLNYCYNVIKRDIERDCPPPPSPLLTLMSRFWSINDLPKKDA